MKIEILLDGIILTFLGLSLLISIGLLIIILICLRPFHSNVSMFLTLNTYITLFLTSIMMSIIYFYNLYGDINSLVSVKDRWCELRAYFVNVCFCALYYSCVLKSIFRLFRIVFSQSKYLRSYLIFLNGIFLQWFLSFILILLNLWNNDYQYLSYQYRCWISFENSRGLLIAATIIYICPLSIMFFIYTYIVRYVHQTKSIVRNTIVFKRIVIFILVNTGIGLPTVSILFIWIISGKLIPLAYHIQGLSMSIGLFVATIGFAFITPSIQKLFHQ